MTDDASTEELKRRQAVKERAERQEAAEAMTDGEANAHRRRAEKAAYLREKLGERQQAEAEIPEESS